MKHPIQNYAAAVNKTMNSLDFDKVDEIIDVLEALWHRKGTLFICGNGGAGATASHMATDFSKGLRSDDGRVGIDVRCLSDNIPTLTAWSNDSCYERALSEVLMVAIRPTDCLMVLSGSGNSNNVVEALHIANGSGAISIGISGMGGGKVAYHSRYPLIIPSDNMQVCEDTFGIVLHGIYLELLKRNA